MSAVSSWVLSIVGIIILSILVDVILPDDAKISKFIKNIFGYLIIIVILSPIFTFFSKKDFNLDNLFSTSSVEVQQGFVAKVNRQYLDQIEKDIENKCDENGFKFVEVGIQADIFENTMNITNVNIDLHKVNISHDAKNKDVRSSIIDIVESYIKIDKELIVFYG